MPTPTQTAARRSTARRLVVAAGTVLGLVAVVGLVSVANQPQSTAAARPTCGLSNQAFVTTRDFSSAFVTLGDNTQTAPPVGFQHKESLQSFVAGRIVGLLAAVALSPKYKAEQDARARALNYQPGPLPLLPLQGRVVAENPVPLEIYQADWAYRSITDANDFMSTVVGSNHSQGAQPFQVRGFTAVDLGGAWIFPSSSAESETSFDVDFRVDGTVVQLGIRGGSGITEMSAESIANTVREHVIAGCSR